MQRSRLRTDLKPKALLSLRILPDGAFEQWNYDNPALQVTAGDRIVAVGGDKLLAEDRLSGFGFRAERLVSILLRWGGGRCKRHNETPPFSQCSSATQLSRSKQLLSRI